MADSKGGRVLHGGCHLKLNLKIMVYRALSDFECDFGGWSLDALECGFPNTTA
jgi:hypothetical protein